MAELQTTIITSTMGIMTVLVGLVVQSLKKYLHAKGGKDAIKIVEILARNAVHAVEQVAKVKGIKGADKLLEAKLTVLNELSKHHIQVTDQELTVFIEAAVNRMNQSWKPSLDEE